MRSRASLMLAFMASLHVLVLYSLITGNLGRVAPAVVLVSVVPLGLAADYLLGHITRRLSWLDIWVLMYAAWSLASLVLYLQPGNPTRPIAYAFGVYNFVLPMACYFAMKSVSREQHTRVLSGLVLLNAFAVAYGLYLYVARPAFYTAYLTDRLTKGATDIQEWQYFARLQSYLGSTSVGYMCAVTLIIVTLSSPRVRRLVPGLIPLFIVGAALSLQRASLLAAGIALTYLAFKARASAAMRAFMLVAIAGTLVYGIVLLQGTFKERLETRVTSDMTEGLSRFFSERGYKPGLAYLRVFPLGVGVGATSSAANNAGLLTKPEVADANFMRIAADLGVEGLLFYLLVLGAAAARAWRSRHRAAWLCVLTAHSGIMLSTNVFDSYYISHTFWLLLAVIDRDAEPEEVPVRATERLHPMAPEPALQV